ncbi:MAG: ribosome-associated translation inhibitor RaiA [Candidatus Kapabacteria bacterium]|nr:ribosome-associated translation inhibitor RaiA [Candidatus Kapabacteria bacterium]
MDIHISNRHCTITDAEYENAVSTAKRFEKFNLNIVRTDFLFDEVPLQKFCEITVRIHDHLLVAKETASDFTKAAHDAGLKMERQLAKVHDKSTTVRP